MFCENACLKPNDVDRDERTRLTKSAESAVQEDEISLRDSRAVLVAKFGRQGLDQAEKTLATGWDMSTVLDVLRRKIGFGCLVVALVKQRVERLDDKCFWFRC